MFRWLLAPFRRWQIKRLQRERHLLDQQLRILQDGLRSVDPAFVEALEKANRIEDLEERRKAFRELEDMPPPADDRPPTKDT